MRMTSAVLGLLAIGASLLTLEQAGHKVEVIPNETALREAMAARRLDFVLADLDDAPGLARGLPGAGAPQIVPVTGKDADKAASADYALVIRSGKSLLYLSALEAAMARRSGGSSR